MAVLSATKLSVAAVWMVVSKVTVLESLEVDVIVVTS
jgi:hypothetical protein